MEINTREHGRELKLIENGWFAKQTSVTTYCLEELIAIKFRALYSTSERQRLI